MANKAEGPDLSGVLAGLELAAGLARGDALSIAAAASGAIDWLREHNLRRQERIVQKLLQDAYFQNSSDPGAYSEFKGLFEGGDLKSQNAKDVFLLTVRTAEATVDDAVLPALAMLMREYQREGKKADSFFRAVSRLLQDLSADEFASLRALTSGVVARRSDSAVRRMRLPGTAITYEVEVTSPGTYATDRSKVECSPDHVAHLFHLLDVNGLGDLQHDQLVGGDASETHVILVRLETAWRMAALMPTRR